MTDIEKLSERRRWLLVTMGISFLIWQVADLDVTENLEGMARGGFAITGTVSALVWLAALILLFVSFRRPSTEARSHAALEDELVKANRRIAFAAGYAAMMLAAAGLFLTSIFADLLTKDALNAVLVAGIVTPMFAFAWLEGRGG